jgi:hypothetical protein
LIDRTPAQLLEAADIGDGHAMVFDWIDAVPLGVSTSRSQRLSDLSLCQRVNAQLIYDFHVYGPITVGWR